MKILMIGLGSVGQRHLRNIKRVYGDKFEIIAFRTRRLQETFSDNMQIRDGINLEAEYGLKVYSDLSLALQEKPDIAYITAANKYSVPVPETDTGGRGENPKADERSVVKELGKMAP